MRISDWSSDVCSSDLRGEVTRRIADQPDVIFPAGDQPRLGRFDLAHRQRHARFGLRDVGWPGIADIEPVARLGQRIVDDRRSEEHTSELQSLMRNSYAVFCLKKQTHT